MVNLRPAPMLSKTMTEHAEHGDLALIVCPDL